MRHTITLLLAGLCAVARAETAPVRDAAAAPVAIYVGAEKVSDGVLAEMRKEVESVTGRGGLRLSWQSLDGPRETADYSEVLVVRVVGDCNAFDAPPPTTGVQKIMGSTHTADGQILPFGDVFCEPVLQVIRPSLAGASQQERERLLGRALGRVLSHELYHMLGRTARHGAAGVAKSTQSRQDLVTKEFRFDKRDEEKLSTPASDSSAGSSR